MYLCAVYTETISRLIADRGPVQTLISNEVMAVPEIILMMVGCAA